MWRCSAALRKKRLSRKPFARRSRAFASDSGSRSIQVSSNLLKTPDFPAFSRLSIVFPKTVAQSIELRIPGAAGLSQCAGTDRNGSNVSRKEGRRNRRRCRRRGAASPFPSRCRRSSAARCASRRRGCAPCGTCPAASRTFRRRRRNRPAAPSARELAKARRTSTGPRRRAPRTRVRTDRPGRCVLPCAEEAGSRWLPARRAGRGRFRSTSPRRPAGADLISSRRPTGPQTCGSRSARRRWPATRRSARPARWCATARTGVPP